MPEPGLAAKWREAAPAGFQYFIKAWQLITHTPASPTYRRLKTPVPASHLDLLGSFRPTEQVWLAWERTQEVARALDARVILFQCPASFKPTTENVRNFREFFQHVDRDSRRLAWEPRGSWPAELVCDLCAEFDLVHCVDPFQGSSVHGEMVYWRLHGRGSYFYTYSEEEIEWLKQQALARITDRIERVCVLFNNTSMKNDATRLQAALAVE
jgi:uncharacterized protein YecE (DUF72 family)